MMRIMLFLATNAAVLVLISIVFQVLGLEGILAENNVDLNLQALLVMSAVIGFGGSFISLAMSKMMAKRGMGKTMFAPLDDEWGRLQVYFKKDDLGTEDFKRAQKLLDLGDIIGVEGFLFETRTGELTIHVERWELLAKAYYTAELLGVTDQVHPALFEALHEKNQKIENEATLQDLFVNHGVSAEDFSNTFNSFAVSVKMNNAKSMTRRYGLTGVPTVIVNGTFSTSGRQAGGNAGIIRVVDYLVAQERDRMASAADTDKN